MFHAQNYKNLVIVVKDILDKVGLYNNIPELESKESAKQKRNQQGKGLKILTPNQILNRLPISLAQLNEGNDSEKLKNETRQLLHFLYRSRKLTRNIYKTLTNII